MIEKYTAHCDRCSHYEEFETKDFRQIIEKIKELGWRIFKVGNLWLHYCPDCANNKKHDIDKKQKTWWDEEKND